MNCSTMSSSLNHEEHDEQPPTKRQRIRSEGTTFAPSGPTSTLTSTQSGLTSPPCLGTTKGISSSSSPSAVSARLPVDSVPSFNDNQERDDSCSSIESALGVPARILFRLIGDDRKEPKGATTQNGKRRRRLRPLLSRQEAEQFLRLTLLAQEIDVLVDLSETVLSRRQFANRFRRDVLMQRGNADASASNDVPWRNPWLSTLGPILDVLEKRQSNPSNENQFVPNQHQQNPQDHILYHIHNELARLYHELQACGVYELERSAEQNRSLVASLTDILGCNLDDDVGQDHDSDSEKTSAVRNLAREKRSLSKLQDLLAKRVRSLLIVLCHSRPTTTTEKDDANDDGAAKLDVGANSVNYNLNDRKQILFDERLPSTSNDKNTSPTKKAPHDGSYSDGSPVLSLEEILVPLEVVCEKLFETADRKATSMSTRFQNENDSVSDNCLEKLENEEISDYHETIQDEKQQQTQQEKIEHDRTNKKSFLSKAATSLSTTTNGNGADSGFSVEDSHSMRKIEEKETIQPCSGEEVSDPAMMMVEASQRAVGAAAAMMDLMTKKYPQEQQNPVNDDGSFVDDPPSDGEDRHNETPSKDKVMDRKEKNNVGIFDVVDVLTPHSQSQS